MMHEEYRIPRRKRRRHPSADVVVHHVVRQPLQRALGAAAVQNPGRIETILVERTAGAELLIVRRVQDILQHGGADKSRRHRVGVRPGPLPGLPEILIVDEQPVLLAVGRGRLQEDLRHGGIGGPIPVRHGEVLVARHLSNDALIGQQVGPVPGQEIPVAVRAELVSARALSMDAGQRRPARFVARRLLLQDSNAVAIGRDDGIVPGKTLERPPLRRLAGGKGFHAGHAAGDDSGADDGTLQQHIPPSECHGRPPNSVDAFDYKSDPRGSQPKGDVK